MGRQDAAKPQGKRKDGRDDAGKGELDAHPRQRPGTSFHDLLYGIIAGIALTQFVEFGFWNVGGMPARDLAAWTCFLVLYLWGVLKMTVFWLGARDDFLSLSRRLEAIRVWEYLGGVLVAMLLGLLPFTAVMCASEILVNSNSAAAGAWVSKFPVLLGAHTLATSVANVVVAIYVIWRLRGRFWRWEKGNLSVGGAESDIEPRLLKPRLALVIPILTDAFCWLSWLLALRSDQPLAGLISAAVLIPTGSAIEEVLLWRSRLRHRAMLAREREGTRP